MRFQNTDPILSKLNSFDLHTPKLFKCQIIQSNMAGFQFQQPGNNYNQSEKSNFKFEYFKQSGIYKHFDERYFWALQLFTGKGCQECCQTEKQKERELTMRCDESQSATLTDLQTLTLTVARYARHEIHWLPLQHTLILSRIAYLETFIFVSLKICLKAF